MHKLSGRTALTMMLGLAISITAAARAPEPTGALTLTRLATYTTSAFGEGAAEIVTFDPEAQRLFVVNARAATLDVLDIRNPAAPAALEPIDVGAYGAVANSAASRGGVVAVAVENTDKTEPGTVAFLSPEGELLSRGGSMWDHPLTALNGLAVISCCGPARSRVQRLTQARKATLPFALHGRG